MKKKDHNKHDKEADNNQEALSDLEKELNQAKEKDPVDLLEQLEKKQIEYETLLDKHLRLGAEFDNVRKRWEREKQDIHSFSNFRLINELIVIVDALEQALKVEREHNVDVEVMKGVEIIYKNLLSILNKHGVKAIEAVGNKFDPHIHEIVGQKECDDKEEHIVLEDAQKGYMLEDKLLRTSKVIIGINKKTQETEEEGQNT